jgi:hypothetical protein
MDSDGPTPARPPCAAPGLPPVEFDTEPLGAAERPSFEQATLVALCREASDIGYQLAMAYAMALTFRRAVRDYIPVDDLDITPCLSAGVIDVLDAQVHRLDTLRDHLTRAFYTPGAAHRTPAAGTSGDGTVAGMNRPGAGDTEEAGVGRHAVRRTP